MDKSLTDVPRLLCHPRRRATLRPMSRGRSGPHAPGLLCDRCRQDVLLPMSPSCFATDVARTFCHPCPRATLLPMSLGRPPTNPIRKGGDSKRPKRPNPAPPPQRCPRPALLPMPPTSSVTHVAGPKCYLRRQAAPPRRAPTNPIRKGGDSNRPTQPLSLEIHQQTSVSISPASFHETHPKPT